VTAALVYLALCAGMADPRPPLADAGRLPGLESLQRDCEVAGQYYHWAKKQADWWGESGNPTAEYWRQAAAEAYLLWHWHYLARNARTFGYAEDYRRDCLDELRAMSREAYYSGNWPPAVPVWRLPRR